MSLGDDDTVRDPAVMDSAMDSAMESAMDSAMDTGSDAGEPGDRLDEGPLTGAERALLDRLAADERPDVVTDAPEDSDAEARAVADDTVLPEDPPPGGTDPDTPQFRDAP